MEINERAKEITMKDGTRRLLVDGAWSLAIPDGAEVKLYRRPSLMGGIFAEIIIRAIQFGVLLCPGKEMLTLAEAQAVNDLTNQRVIDQPDLLVGIEYNNFGGIHDFIGHVRTRYSEPVDINGSFNLTGIELRTVMEKYKTLLGSVMREDNTSSLRTAKKGKIDSMDIKQDDESESLTWEQVEGLRKIQAEMDKMQSSLSTGLDVMKKHREREEQLAREKEEKRKIAAEGGKRRSPPKGDKAFSELYMVLRNEELLAPLVKKHEDLFDLYEEDFLMYTRASFTKAIGELGLQMQSPERLQAYEEAFRGVELQRRYELSTLNLFNLLEWHDFERGARQALEWTKQFYTADEFEQVQQILQEDIEVRRQSCFSAIEALNTNAGDFSQAKSNLQVSIMEMSKLSNFQESNLLQQKIGALAVIVEMTAGEFSIVSAKIPDMMAGAWKVTPDDLWKEAIRNRINDQREKKTGDAKRFAEQARELASQKYDAMALPYERSEGGKAKKASVSIPQNQQPAHASRGPAKSVQPTQSSDGQKRSATLKKEIAELSTELNNIMGWFKGRQKRELAERIREKTRELDRLEREI